MFWERFVNVPIKLWNSESSLNIRNIQFLKMLILGYMNVRENIKGTFHLIVLQTLWEF